MKELQQFALLDWCCSQLIQEGQTSCALMFDIGCKSRCAQAAQACKEKITMNVLRLRLYKRLVSILGDHILITPACL